MFTLLFEKTKTAQRTTSRKLTITSVKRQAEMILGTQYNDNQHKCSLFNCTQYKDNQQNCTQYNYTQHKDNQQNCTQYNYTQLSAFLNNQIL
jgi:hypothetical protein